MKFKKSKIELNFHLFSFENQRRIFFCCHSLEISLLENLYSSWCNILFLLHFLWFYEVVLIYSSQLIIHNDEKKSMASTMFSWFWLYLWEPGTALWTLLIDACMQVTLFHLDVSWLSSITRHFFRKKFIFDAFEIPICIRRVL